MKRILLLFAVIPIILFGQTKKPNSTKPPLIQSITSDTVNGKFNQLFFSYDELDRVTSITKKEIIITTDSKKINKQVEQITEKQDFEYKGDSTKPFARKLVSYESYDEGKKWYLAKDELHYFLFKDGKRVGDSILYVDDETKVLKLDYVDKLIQTNKRIYCELDLSRPYIEPGGGINTYFDEFKLSSQFNISFETSEWTIGRDRTGSYYTFTKYDNMLNPLKQLNIAGTLINEKLSLISSGKYSKMDICWYFLNQNNFLNLNITTDERSSAFREIYSFSYSYNQYKQPIYAKAQVKEESREQGFFNKKYQKRFTFRYKK